MTPPIIEARSVSKFFGTVVAIADVSISVQRGRGRLPPRRQRRRQVDPDQDALRAERRTRGRSPSTASRWSSPRRATPSPAASRPSTRTSPSSPDEHLAELHARHGADQAGRAALASSTRRRPARSPARSSRKIGIEVNYLTQKVGTHVRRRAPVGGDRPRRVPRRPTPHPRRADLGSRRQRGGDRAPPRHRARARGPRRGLHHPQRASRAADRRPLRHP